ncbi:hypothetical protein L6452_31165 [Arctium lappa]|uniref:Uncharacterized protein n=1 Tax=Arctium lappa TaxID=4217 RepID=A0ACB8ZL56_ARCLA|nr:hypothetical protein L6452_31165 [Arctium lappa]
MGKEDLSSYDKIVVNESFAQSIDSKVSKVNAERVHSQNMVDESRVIEVASVDHVVLEGKVIFNAHSTRVTLCANWSKMTREEKRNYVKTEEAKKMEKMRVELSRKKYLERVKKIVGFGSGEVITQDIALMVELLGNLDGIGNLDAVFGVKGGGTGF